jgi:hypothetical protein
MLAALLAAELTPMDRFQVVRLEHEPTDAAEVTWTITKVVILFPDWAIA